MKIIEQRKFNNESTSERIIQAAKELFIEYGFKDTTIKMIARKAKVNESTLFRHFKSKEGVFIEITKEITQYSNSKLEHILERDIPLEEVFFRFGIELYKVIVDSRGILLIMVIEFKKRSELSKNVTNALISIIKILDKKLKELYEKGQIEKNDFFAISMMYVESLLGFFVVQSRLEKELIPIELENLSRSASKVLLNGLLK